MVNNFQIGRLVYAVLPSHMLIEHHIRAAQQKLHGSGVSSLSPKKVARKLCLYDRLHDTYGFF